MAMTLTAADIKHREEFKEFVLRDSDAWYRPLLKWLYESWESYAKDLLECEMTPPYILLSPPARAQAIGDYGEVSSFGGHSQIRIRPTLFSGEHKLLRDGDEYEEGRALFIADVLLHEFVHQYQHEIDGEPEESYRGHGPRFAATCNRIGEKLSLPPVRVAKARGKDKDLPSCAQWPHCVRPAGYYLGAYVNDNDGELAGEGDGGEAEAESKSKAEDERGRALLLLIKAALAVGKLWPEGSEGEALAVLPDADAERLSALLRAAREL